VKNKLLIVENDAIGLQYLDILLNSLYEIDSANNAPAALELVNKNNYDAFLLDINLGSGMDGIELMKEIKKIKNYANTPFIAITAFAAESDKREFLSKGFTHYLSKPFLSTELKVLLKEIFN